jgi:hypothetical protein
VKQTSLATPGIGKLNLGTLLEHYKVGGPNPVMETSSKV